MHIIKFDDYIQFNKLYIIKLIVLNLVGLVGPLGSHGFLWVPMDFRGFPWVSVDLCG